MTSAVHVLARFVAHEETAQELLDLLGSLLAPTRAESGCVRYDLWRSRSDERRFTLVEAWMNEESLARHLETPHLLHAKERFAVLLAEPLVLERFELIG